jgi:6-phosphogluconolactonase (cycloisomerase 2 family)
VFVANNVSDGIASFTVNADGTLDHVATVPTADGPQAIDLAPGGRFLAVAHGTANEVSEILRVFAVDATAALTEVASILVPDSPLDVAWINDEILAVTETNVGPPNFVRTWRLDERAGTLLPVDVEATGSFNSALAYHPAAGVLYTQDSFSDSITWFTAAPDGTLAFGGTVFTQPEFPLELALTPGGGFLYAACGISGDGHRILGYSVGPAGSLAAIKGSPYFSPGTSPAHLAVSADGAWLFAGHGTDATLRSFSIDPGGAIVATGFSFDVGLQGTLGDIAVLPGLVFVTDESTATDGITGLYSFHVNGDGTLTQAAPIYDTLGVRPESLAAWQPPRVPGDVDGDGTVGILDFLALLAAWGPCPAPCPPSCPADFDGDCAVSITDFLTLLANWT